MAGSEARERSRRVNRLLLNGYASSGSDHDAGVLDGIFFSDEENSNAYQDDASEKSPTIESNPFPAAMMVKDLLHAAAVDTYAAVVTARAAAAAEQLSSLRANRAAFTRAIMTALRVFGYNAGVCKARWESRGGVTGGCYEYIDVLYEESHQNKRRYILEVAFREEFEIARPTAEYERILEQLPKVYVGKAEELKRIIRILGDAAKRSLQSREMYVPPWRKSQYMLLKWLGTYRRTTNPNSACTAAAAPCLALNRDVKCRLLGFYGAAPLGASPAGRTRLYS